MSVERTLPLTGMDCADCALTLEKGVGRLPGVLGATVSFTAAKMRVEYDAQSVDESAIIRRIRELGYDVGEDGRSKIEDSRISDSIFHPRSSILLRTPRDLVTVLAGAALVVGFLLEVAGTPILIANAAYGLAIVLGIYFPARSGLAALRTTSSLDINLLMSVAAVGAVAIGAWQEGAFVIFLFSLGESLESYTMDRARAAIGALMSLAPNEATRLDEHGHEACVPVTSLDVGDIILVRPGERIPIDGVVAGGSSSVNQAPITGESMPVEKAPGDEVYASTVNERGALEVRVTVRADDTTLARIVEMVEEAQAQKAPTQRFVDRFARIYTPAVVAGAALMAVVPPLVFHAPFTAWFYRALVLLVIACPCALVISTPVSIVAAISRAARDGVLIKGGAHLEELGRVRAIAFDKTGTLTHGRPEVTDVLPIEDREVLVGERLKIEDRRSLSSIIDPRSSILQLAASVESRSEHPIARAIVRAARHQGIGFETVVEFEALSGRGARGRAGDGRELLIGNVGLFEARGIPVSNVLRREVEKLELEGKTVMIAGESGQVAGLIAVSDEVRRDARYAVERLRAMGVACTMMLTGDNERTARAVCDALGIDEARANLLPEQKVEAIDELVERYGSVAMVGDGVNDAPALARATVGIAMGAAGADQALETADVALMADDLSKLPLALDLGRRARQTIAANIAFSLLIKGAFIVLGLFGVATLWEAVFADMGTSLLVIFNGMRLLRFGARRHEDGEDAKREGR